MYIIDPTNPVIALCLQGARAEFDHCPADARRLYEQAWLAAGNDFEAAIAAHYQARFTDSPQERLHWNQEALRRALAVPD